jgi:hypothetical protein
VTVIYCKQNNELVNPSLCGVSPRPKDIIKSCNMLPCDSVSKVMITYFIISSFHDIDERDSNFISY